MSDTLTINYYYPTGSGLISSGIIGTSNYTGAATSAVTFQIPDNTGSPLFTFSPAVPATAGGFPFTGWDSFTDTSGNYPITPGAGQAFWLNGEAGQIVAVASIYAGLGGTTGPIVFNVTAYYAAPIPICFKEDSEILTYDEAADKESYVKVQDLRKGMLVKTLRSGYVPVKIATTSKVYNPGNGKRSENCLYRCPTSVFPELKEDLIITGHHSILVDNLTEEQVNEIQDTYGRIYITEKKYRLPAFVDERTVPYEEEGTFNIYHFALENSNVKANYGVYANGGLLVESANEWRLREKSGHKIISE